MPFLVTSPWIGLLFTSPDQLKSAWGISFIVIGLSWWVFNQIKSEEIIIIKTDLYLPMFGFLAWCFITLWWVEDGYLAAMMLAQFSSFVIIFVLIVNTFKHFDLAIRTLKILVFSMTIVSIIGLLQYYFPDNKNIEYMFIQVVKPAATFGNKNMASHFIVMTLPLSLMLILDSKTHINIILYTLTTFIGSWFLMYTVARQAYVAVALELLVLIIFMVLDYYKNNHRSLLHKISNKSMKIIAITGVVASLALVANLTDKGWNFDSENIFNKVKAINIDGGSARLPAWRNTLEMIKDNPIAGVGIGQWPQSYPLYYDRAMKDVIFNEKTRLRRLHNDYLETFANVGLIGYMFLFWLLFLVSKKILKVLTNPDHQYRIQILGVTLGLIGFSIVAFFSFPVRVYLPAFLVFVYFAIVFLSESDYSLENDRVKFKTSRNSYIGLIFVVFLAIFSVYYSYRWIMAHHYYSQSILFSKVEQYPMALLTGLKAVETNNWSKLYYENVAAILIKTKQYQRAEPYFKKVIDISPFNTQALLNLALIYSEKPTLNLEKQRKVLEFILSFDSKNIPALCFLVKNLIESDRERDATVLYARLKNSFEYFNGRNNFGPYHSIVGFLSRMVGDYKYAQYIYKDAITQNPSAENYYNLSVVEFNNLHNYKIGADFARKALEIDPNMPRNNEAKALIEKYESGTQQ